MPVIGEFATGVGIGTAVAVGNFSLSVMTAKFASTKSAAVATGAAMLSMGVRLPVLAWLLMLLFKSGYHFGPLIVSFVITYTMLMGVEVVLVNRERG